MLSFDQPMSKSLSYSQPPSRNNFLATLRCLSVHSSFVLLRNRARAGSSQIPSFNSSYSCFAAHFFQNADLPCSKNRFLTSFGQTNLMSTLTCPSKVQMCHRGRFMPKSRVSHITALASPLSLPFSVTDNLRPFSQLLLFKLFINCLAIVATSLFFQSRVL